MQWLINQEINLEKLLKAINVVVMGNHIQALLILLQENKLGAFIDIKDAN
jgi:hypothetical protein